jgi:hypothetical protein
MVNLATRRGPPRLPRLIAQELLRTNSVQAESNGVVKMPLKKLSMWYLILIQFKSSTRIHIRTLEWSPD